MLKGLEISIVKLSEVLSDVETFRLDAEYHLKEYVRIANFIKQNKKRFLKFSDLNLKIDCSAFYAGVEQYYGKGDFPMIRVQNIKDCIDYDNCECIPRDLPNKTGYETLKTVEKGDIVITKGGSIGFVGYVTKEACVSRDLIFVKSSILSERLQLFLYIYLSTNFIYKQLIRSSSQCAQPHLTITLVKNLDLLNVSEAFQIQIERMVKEAHFCLAQSRQLYSQAEDLLLRELGFKDWQPQNKAVSIKKFSDFAFSGRLDAEYYQSKYDEFFTILNKKKCCALCEIVSIKKSVEPGSEAYKDSGIPFVRVSDVTKFGIEETGIFLSPNDFNLDSLKPKKDTILLSKDGSIGIAYKIEKNLDVITSGALLHLSIINENCLPDYLTLVLNSVVVKLQSERDSSGAIIQHWKQSDIQKVIIPLLPLSIQKEIASLIQKSFSLKAQSNALLQKAKQAVEEEIEAKK